MIDPTRQTNEATEAEHMGERPDRGRTPDALSEALTGSGMGSDTRAGSLQGGAATGSDDDPDQAAVDRLMRDHGQAAPDAPPPPNAKDTVVNTGLAPGVDGGNAATRHDRDADAATG